MMTAAVTAAVMMAAAKAAAAMVTVMATAMVQVRVDWEMAKTLPMEGTGWGVKPQILVTTGLELRRAWTERTAAAAKVAAMAVEAIDYLDERPVRLEQMERTMWKVLSALAAVVCWSGESLAQEEPYYRVRPYNLSSHTGEFFRGLLENRVWVFRFRGSPAAMYFSKDGAAEGCWLSRDNSRFARSRVGMGWRVGTPMGPGNLEINWPTSEGMNRYRMVIIYDRVSGKFHGERFNVKKRRWREARSGWLQDSWPAALKRVCKSTNLPWDLPINERQDSLEWAGITAAGSPLKNYPGSEMSFPGAVGLAASNGKPVMTVQEAFELRKKAHGMVSIGMSGEKRVVVARSGYTELWAIDENGNISDIARSERVESGTITLVRWERSGKINSYYVGYAFPLIVTEKRHAAFEMMKNLVDSGKEVSLKQDDGKSVSVRFREGEVLRSVMGGRQMVGRPGPDKPAS